MLILYSLLSCVVILIYACTSYYLDENPVYDDIKQQELFRENKPSKPAGREEEELRIFCNQVQFILHAVNEDEYRAAVTLMKPPSNTTFKKAVNFPRPETVIGMFADKKTALIHISEGSECSDFVHAVMSSFPNALFIIGVGFAYALKNDYTFGDVLVSEQICQFRFKNEKLSSGQRIDVVKDLSATFCMNRIFEFKVSDKDRHSEVDAGKFATVPADVESKETHEKICSLLNKPIGGDMEGGEIMKFRFKGKVEGIVLIKGVSCDANGRREDEWDFTASKAALSYTESKLHSYIGKLNHIKT